MRILLSLTTFLSLLWITSSASIDFTQQFQLYNQNQICVHANLLPHTTYRKEAREIQGYISSCYYNERLQTVIRGHFTNLPSDSNLSNYHFYLLNPDNSLRRDLSQLFQRGLIINKNDNSAELLLNLKKSSDFPLDGINSYVNGWVKLYHLRDSVVSSTCPAQFHQTEHLLEPKYFKKNHV
ncbi:2564_t:CDS:1 [Funneliformis geosporum]|uniref:16554_t:CDS:1 n=1 Tax=Funneliformis geosporum TaxID=1117311 RepID=A0A9W4X097_9GLOM|nr:2564_t:CDS:1 [Funneliformis geosporum]CAI2176852.1 16554_t:CDS:1 [Funneliformis geosporum]